MSHVHGPEGRAAPRRQFPAPALRDGHGRFFTYLRLAVNNYCPFRCPYCAPQGFPKGHNPKNLTFSEHKRLISLAARLGVTKIRFTGGEPLLEPHLPELISWARREEITDIHVTTNGAEVASRLKELLAAGLTGMNISLDSLRIPRLQTLTGYRHAARILEGVEAAFAEPGLRVKLNVVMLRELNEDELQDFIELYRRRDWTIRFIELMPFNGSTSWYRKHYLPAAEIYSHLRQLLPEAQPVLGKGTEELRWKLPGHRHWLAVIPGFSRTFCKTCDRLRITAEGELKNCLYAKETTDLRTLLRTGAADEQIMQLITDTMRHKPIDGWAADRSTTVQPQMIEIGG